MGFLSEIKKLLFASKSVASHQVDKGIEFSKEKSQEFGNVAKSKVEDLGNDIKDRTTGLRDAILEKSNDLVDRAQQGASDMAERFDGNELIDDAKDFTESVGAKILDTGKNLKDKISQSESYQKASQTIDNLSEKASDFGRGLKEKVESSESVKQAADFTENVGDKVLDAGEGFMDKVKDLGQTLDQKAGTVLDKSIEKGGELKEKLDEKIDDIMAKADAEAEREAAMPKKEFADDVIDTGDSLLKGSDDFFSKAQRYADGDYGAMSEGKTKISKMTPDAKAKDPNSKAAGFDDLDGDGDEIVDDAIILDD